MKLPKFKIHPHAISHIMTDTNIITEVQLKELHELENKEELKGKPRTALQDQKLQSLIQKRDAPWKPSETTLTYIRKWVISQLYDRKEKIKTNPMEKGLRREDDSIKELSNWWNTPLEKNEKTFENEWIKGTPDILKGKNNPLTDVKNSYSCFSFPLFDKESHNISYFAQAQGYFDITEAEETDEYKLVYILMDLPADMILKEFSYKNDKNLEYEEFEKDFLYEHIKDEKLRKKEFIINYDGAYIQRVHVRVEQIRDYIVKEMGYEFE